MYRRPRGNQSKFLEEIEQVVHNSKHSTKSFFLVGDLNLNSLDYASSTHTKTFSILRLKTEFFQLLTDQLELHGQVLLQ